MRVILADIYAGGGMPVMEDQKKGTRMTVTLNLPPAVEQAYLAEAQARGVSVDELVRDVVLSATPQSEYQELHPDAWIRKFHEWVHSHADITAVLSDEAMERDSIYEDRGL